ncbi:hypothetical protein [Telluribacter sp.]|jgi:hypothetical protein|uniref:hypothetical protein n=1 Tax=Telluribacter sp. TaxID=1978767 RepID=UPI002E0D7540|nr:hypothetical protein [Telluribacter sp.]
MKLRKIAALVAGVALLSSCDYQKYNRIEQDDVREGSNHIYGAHPDSAASQLTSRYEDNPDMDKRATAIREKLFAETPGAASATTSRLDSAAGQQANQQAQ